MNITVINGTEKHGVTYRLKEMFLAEFKDKANITEYYLPKDHWGFNGRYCLGQAFRKKASGAYKKDSKTI